ncbi:hypothetical protein CC80DRAFT_548966 [Byssothecium circinans]|uniref:Uncharacterized protein n=1 Tax=Byssothecium circinans TaxID=147558 RepID=A0A6A5TTC7_9PLEO|nr:hypothetical protein CC80DRAFT_548966 [Byssothecium circinans]
MSSGVPHSTDKNTPGDTPMSSSPLSSSCSSPRRFILGGPISSTQRSDAATPASAKARSRKRTDTKHITLAAKLSRATLLQRKGVPAMSAFLTAHGVPLAQFDNVPRGNRGRSGAMAAKIMAMQEEYRAKRPMDPCRHDVPQASPQGGRLSVPTPDTGVTHNMGTYTNPSTSARMAPFRRNYGRPYASSRPTTKAGTFTSPCASTGVTPNTDTVTAPRANTGMALNVSTGTNEGDYFEDYYASPYGQWDPFLGLTYPHAREKDEEDYSEFKWYVTEW